MVGTLDATSDLHAAPRPKIGAPTAIRTLNDAFRQSFEGGRVLLTAGLPALPEGKLHQVLRAVRAFGFFNTGNDPHGEHDFGVVEVAGTRCFWKIDYYNQDLDRHSPDPADPAVTVPVLTVMLGEEY